jgi:dienelactone hydrolase
MHIEDISYDVRGETMVGHLALDDHHPGPKPAVLVSHEGSGLDGHAKAIAEKLAGIGYVGFALDWMGNGDCPPLEEAMARITELTADPARAGALALAGLDILVAQPATDHNRVAAIGFCYGGVLSLELARTGANVQAVVGFHPGFTPPRTEASRHIRGSVLMCCGTEDPFATRDQRAAFEVEMHDAGVADWRIELYGGVKHSFTNPTVDLLGIPGLEYNARAERHSWRSMLALLDETIGPA